MFSLQQTSFKSSRVKPLTCACVHYRYKYVEELGRGTYGRVVLVADKFSSEYLAVKLLPLSKVCKLDKQVRRECTNHALLDHPHIISLRNVFIEEDNLCLAMEYAKGGDLCRAMVESGRAFEENKARTLFQQLMLAVDYCHRQGIVNRDIKLEVCAFPQLLS